MEKSEKKSEGVGKESTCEHTSSLGHKTKFSTNINFPLHENLEKMGEYMKTRFFPPLPTSSPLFTLFHLFPRS